MAKPKLALIPAAQGTKLYSVLPSDGTGDFTFTRGSVATRINAQGLIENVASGQSRLDYPLIDGVQKGCPHHILEPARTNIVPRSEDIDTGWSKINTTVANNQTISPNGTLNAGLVTATTATGQHILFDNIQNSVTAGSDCFISCFVKKSTTRYIGLNDWYSGALIYIDLDTNSIISETGGASESIIENYGNGWFRVGFKFTAHSSGDNEFVLYVNDNSNNNSYTGSGESVYIWGAQIEQGSYVTSYIPNYGTSAGITRSAETATGAGNSTTFNDSEGVLMAEISALANDGTTRQIDLSFGAANSDYVRLEFATTSNLIYGVIKNTTQQAALSYTLPSSTDLNKIAIKYKVNDFSLFVNGFEVDTDTNGTTPSNLNNLNFTSGTNANPFYGNTKQIQYFDSALDSQQLEQLTSWQSFRDMADGQLYTIE